MKSSLCTPGALLLLSALASADVLMLAPDKDNTLYEEAGGTLSNGAGDWVFSGNIAVGGLRRALVHFDVSGIPAGSTINSVELRLRMDRTIAGAQMVGVHEVLADWGEGDSDAFGEEGTGTASADCDATWIDAFYAGGACSGSLWSTAGGDFDPTASATTSVAGSAKYTWGSSAGLVADVQGWVDTPGTNFGWVLVHVNEVTTTTAKRYSSREGFSPPELEIDFTPPACAVSNYCAVNPNSTGSPAIISFAGSCVAAVDDFTLMAGPVPDQPFLFFFGNSQIQVPFGNGFLCAGGGITRLNPPAFASGGTAVRHVDLPAWGLVAGTHKNFQCWFRDPAGGGAAFNTSDGLDVTFQ